MQRGPRENRTAAPAGKMEQFRLMEKKRIHSNTLKSDWATIGPTQAVDEDKKQLFLSGSETYSLL